MMCSDSARQPIRSCPAVVHFSSEEEKFGTAAIQYCGQAAMPSRAHFARDTRWNLDDVGLNLSSDWPAAGSCRFCQQDSGQGVYSTRPFSLTLARATFG